MLAFKIKIRWLIPHHIGAAWAFSLRLVPVIDYGLSRHIYEDSETGWKIGQLICVSNSSSNTVFEFLIQEMKNAILNSHHTSLLQGIDINDNIYISVLPGNDGLIYGRCPMIILLPWKCCSLESIRPILCKSIHLINFAAINSRSNKHFYESFYLTNAVYNSGDDTFQPTWAVWPVTKHSAICRFCLNMSGWLIIKFILKRIIVFCRNYM